MFPQSLHLRAQDRRRRTRRSRNCAPVAGSLEERCLLSAATDLTAAAIAAPMRHRTTDVEHIAPNVMINSVNPDILWPPNGKFVTVTVTGVARDDLSSVNPSSLRFAVRDEYHTVQPAGPITNLTETGRTSSGGFTRIGFSFQVMLQASRHGYDFDGRHYVIDVFANDMAGHIGKSAAIVTVPHDMGNHGGDGGKGNGHAGGSHGHGNGQNNGNQGGDQGDGNGGDQGDGNGGDHGHGHGHGNGGGSDKGKGHGHG